jgi:hypothetical protein
MWLNITHGKTVWINMIYIYILRFNLTKYKYIYMYLYIYTMLYIHMLSNYILYTQYFLFKKKSSNLCTSTFQPTLLYCFRTWCPSSLMLLVRWKSLERWRVKPSVATHDEFPSVFFAHGLAGLLWHIFLRPAGKLHLLGVQGVFVMGVVEGSRSFLIDSEVNCRNALVPVFTNLSCI